MHTRSGIDNEGAAVAAAPGDVVVNSSPLCGSSIMVRELFSVLFLFFTATANIFYHTEQSH